MASSTQERKEALASHLRAEVLTLALPPGADLDEAALCKRFELSRTPLREVFRDLSGEGYLASRLNRGFRVADLSHDTLRAFFQVAPMIYGAVLKLAAENATPVQITLLRATQERFRDALKDNDIAARSLANNRFHEVTGEMAGNPYLVPSFQRLLIDHARISMTFYRPQTDAMRHKMTLASEQHDAIIDAIEARDSEAAARLAQDHWELSRSEIESYVMPGALEIDLGGMVRARSA